MATVNLDEPLFTQPGHELTFSPLLETTALPLDWSILNDEQNGTFNMSTGPANAEVISFEPTIEPKAPRRIKRAEWKKHENEIRALYPERTLPELRRVMALHHEFTASIQQWKKKLGEWNLKRNLDPKTTRFIKKRAHRRLIEENKETEFLINHEPIPMEKVRRKLRGYSGNDTSPTGSTPTGMSFRTLRSPIVQQPRLPLTTVRSTPAADIISPRPAVWEGRGANELLAIAEDALARSQSGDYEGAKLAFMDSLEGLEAILTPYHAQTVENLVSFVEEALDHDDSDTAIERLTKSWNDHKELLGKNDRRTWRSLARIGHFHCKRGSSNEALTAFLHARRGLLEHTGPSTEGAHTEVSQITKMIINIFAFHGDFEAAETESLELITQAESLGGAYSSDVLMLKHNLVHLYQDPAWRRSAENLCVPAPPQNKIESLLLDVVDSDVPEEYGNEVRLCSYESLRQHYSTTRQTLKAALLLDKAQNFLSTLRPVRGGSFIKALKLKRGIASSHISFGEYDKAQWWLLQCEQEIANSTEHGPNSEEAITNYMLLANFHIDREERDLARAPLQAAQAAAKLTLSHNDPFHELVCALLNDQPVPYDCCSGCHIRPGVQRT